MSDTGPTTTAPVAHTKSAPSTGSTASSGGSSSSGASAPRRALRGLSYKDGAGALAPDSPDAQGIAARGLGGPSRSVSPAAAAKFRAATGADVSGAREHTGPAAQAACADLGGVAAFAQGKDVAYRDASPSEHVRHHELAHVAQAGAMGGDLGAQAYGGGRSGLEQNADAVANAVVSGGTASVAGGSPGLAFYKDGDDPTTGDPGQGEKSEVDAVKEAHGQTIEALVQALIDLRAHRQKVFNLRKNARASTDAKAIFGLLAQYDSQTITAAWKNVQAAKVKDKKGDGEVDLGQEFSLLVDAIGYKDAARSYPREARATLAACDGKRLDALAEANVKKNPFAAELALSCMEDAARADFQARHPELATSKKITTQDKEKLDGDLMALKDASLRKTEEDYRDRKAKTHEADEKKSKEAEAGKADAKPLVDEVTALVTAGKHADGLGKLAGEGRAAVFTAAVRELDQGTLSKMIHGLSFSEKWNDNGAALKRVFGARDAQKNLDDARRLLDAIHQKTRTVEKKNGKEKTQKRKGLITSSEAYEAYHLLKALPPAHREEFQKTYPALVTAMEMALNDSMKEADDTNFFGGEADQATVAELTLKMRDDAFWLGAPVDQLDMTLRIALKANLRGEMKTHLEGMAATGGLKTLFGDAARRAAIEGALGTFATFDPASLPEGTPPEVGWLQTLRLKVLVDAQNQTLNHAQYGFKKGGVARALIHGNRATRKENREHPEKYEQELADWEAKKAAGDPVGDKPHKNPTLLRQVGGALNKKKGFEAKNVALDEIQTTVDAFGQGGTIEFANFGQRKGDNLDEDRNRADLSFDTNNGVFDFKCPHLELTKLRYPLGDMLVETGAAIMKDLVIHVTWPTPHKPDQTSSITATAGSLDISNIVVTQPGALIGIKNVNATGFAYASSEQKIDFGDNPGAEQVLEILKRDNPARSLATFGLSMSGLASKANRQSAADNVAALTAAFTGKPAGSLGGMTLTVDAMNATGVTYNAGTFVEKAGVKDISLVWDNRPSVTGAARLKQLGPMIADAEARLAAIPAETKDATELAKQQRAHDDIARFTKEKGDLEGKIPAWKELEKVYQEIYEFQKLNGPTAPSDEQLAPIRQRAAACGIAGADTLSLSDLAGAVQQRLSSESGLVASVGEISVTGADVEGTKVASATVKGVNVSGQGETFNEAADPALMKRLGAKEGESGKGKPLGTSASLDIASVDVQGVSMAGSAPTVKALEETKAELERLRKVVGDIAAKPQPTEDDKAVLLRDKPKLENLETQWKKQLGGDATFGGVADQLIALSKSPGLEKVKTNADLLGQWRALEDKLRGEPLTVAQISLHAISASGTTQSETSADGKTTTTSSTSALSIGDASVTGLQSGESSVASATVTNVAAQGQTTSTTTGGKTTTTGSGDLSIGGLEATGVKSGTTTVGKVSGKDIHASGTYSEESQKGTDGKTTTSNRVATGQASVGSLGASDIDMGGTHLQDAGLDNLTLGFDSGKGTLDLGIGKIHATGVGLDKGIAAADAKRASLKAQIEDLEKKGKDAGQPKLELQRLEAELGKYQQAYATQTTVLGEVKAIDDKITAAGKRLDAAQREAAVFKHRVERSEEEAIAAADQRRIEAIQKEIEGLQKERAVAQAKLAEPQGIISSFESSLSIKGESSASNVDLHLEGLPSLDKLMSKDADLSTTLKMRLGVGPIVIPTVDYQSPGMGVVLGSGSVPKVEASAQVQVKKVPGPGGVMSYGVGAVDIESFSMPELTGNDLVLTMPVEGEVITITLPKATMLGLSLTGVHLDGFDAASLATASGKLDIASVETSLSARMGDKLSADGHIKATGIHADALASGALNFGINDLTLDQLGFSQTTTKKDKKGNSIVDSIVKMGGKASKLGKVKIDGAYDRVGKTLTTTVGLGDLVLQGVDYRASGTYLGVGYAKLLNASVTVGAKFKSGDVPPGESAMESLELTELKCDYLNGSNIHFEGQSQERERFEDGTEKIHPTSTSVKLKSGTLRGLSVRGLKLVGDGPTKLGLSLGSGTVQGLEAGLKKDGQNVIQANVSAAVSGVQVSLIDKDLHASFSSLKGDVSATLGEGEGAMNFDTKGIDVRGDEKQKTSVDVHDLGEKNQTLDATLPHVKARQIGFESGIKGSGHDKPFVLGSASLDDVKVHDDHDKLSVDIGHGTGAMIGGMQVTGSTTGSTDYQKSQASKDQIMVPTQKVTWTNLQKSTLDGFLRLNYPDKSQFLKLNFSGDGITLDLQQNIDRMWSEWSKGFERDGESWYAYLWKASKSALATPGNLLWTALFKGLETGFNWVGKKLLGDWPEIEKTILSSLNSNPKASIVPGYKPNEGNAVFTTFTQSINKVIQEQVEPAIETACDWGVVTDLVTGDYGRAAKTTGWWLLEQVGNIIDWGGKKLGYENTTDMDDYAQKQQDALRAQRKAELEAMCKSGLDKILGWGLDLDLHTHGGEYRASKEPLPNPGGVQATEMLHTGLDLDVTGGGTLRDMSVGAIVGLSKLRFKEGGNSASIDKITMAAGANGGVNQEFEDQGLRMAQADISGGGVVMVVFDGLHFEQDKNWLPKGAGGIETTHERYKKHGTESNSNSPVANGNAVMYNAADYAHRVNTEQEVYGEQYTEELSFMQKNVVKPVVHYGTDIVTPIEANIPYTVLTGETIGTTVANFYESETVKAKNAEVYGKYEQEYQAEHADKGTQKKTGTGGP